MQNIECCVIGYLTASNLFSDWARDWQLWPSGIGLRLDGVISGVDYCINGTALPTVTTCRGLGV